jgi:serpin B
MKKMLITLMAALMLMTASGCSQSKPNEIGKAYFGIEVRNNTGKNLKSIAVKIMRDDQPVHTAELQKAGELIKPDEVMSHDFEQKTLSAQSQGSNEVTAVITITDEDGKTVECTPLIGFYIIEGMKFDFNLTADKEGGYRVEASFRHRDISDDPVAIEGDTIGMEVFKRLINRNENICFSPLSLEIALSMLYEGAGGETLSQFKAKQSGPLYIKTDKAMLANSMWADDEFRVNAEYLDTLLKKYDSEVFNQNLTGDTYKQINQWISDKTRKLINGVFDEPLSDSMAMVLINALYFKANWASQLAILENGDFTTASGKKITAEYVGDMGNMLVAEDEQWIGAVLPYDDGETKFIALKSKDKPGIPDYQTLIRLTEGAEYRYAEMKMPKLDIEYSESLVEPLRAIGLSDVFDSQKADLTGIGQSDKGNLFVSLLLQKTHLKLDENGTEAAAVTVIGVDTCAAPADEPLKLYFDSSYFFAIVNNGAVMFVGYVDQPAVSR